MDSCTTTATTVKTNTQINISCVMVDLSKPMAHGSGIPGPVMVTAVTLEKI